MHIFFITILILNFFYASPSFSISGTVVDIEDNPISNVTIESEDGGQNNISLQQLSSSTDKNLISY